MRQIRSMSTSDKVSQRAWLSIGVVVVLTILAQIDRNAISIMVDPIKASFQLSDSDLGLLQGPAFGALFLIGSLVVGWMVDRYSKRGLIFIGVTLWSFATLGSAFAGSFTVLILSRCLVGLGESALQPAAWSIMSRLFPPRKLATAIGILTAGAQVGVAASFMLVGLLMTNSQSLSNALPYFNALQPWQWVFVITGILGISLASLVFVIPKEQNKQSVTQPTSSEGLMSYVRAHRSYLFYHFLGFGILSVLVHGAGAWAPTYLMRNHHLDVKQVGLLVGAVIIPLGVGGAIFAGWLVDRSFQKHKRDAHFSHFAYRSVLVAILGGIGFLFDSSLAVPLICFGLIQFIQPFSGVAGASLQISTPEQLRGRISGIFIMFYNAVGLLFGPPVVAWMSDRFGADQLGTALAVNYILFGSIAALLLWTGRKYAAASVISTN